MKAEATKDVHRILVEDRDLIHEAMKKGVRDALLRHKKAGQPVVVARDGEPVWVQVDELDIE